MITIKIDGIDYDTDKLSDESKAQLLSLQFATKNWPACKHKLQPFKPPAWPTPKPCNQHCPPCLQAIRLNSTDAIH